MLDQPAKSPLASLGVIGSGGALATACLNAAGVQIVPGSKADLIATIALAGLGLYGRLRATRKLSTAK